MRLMSSGVALVACLGGAAQKATPGAWVGVFRPLPGARELCNQHVLGGDTPAKRFEIAFTLYGSAKPTADVVRFYAEAHKVPSEPGTNALVVKLDSGRKVLSVFRAADDHPTCGVDPRADEPTVILVSELTMMSGTPPP